MQPLNPIEYQHIPEDLLISINSNQADFVDVHSDINIEEWACSINEVFSITTSTKAKTLVKGVKTEIVSIEDVKNHKKVTYKLTSKNNSKLLKSAKESQDVLFELLDNTVKEMTKGLSRVGKIEIKKGSVLIIVFITVPTGVKGIIGAITSAVSLTAGLITITKTFKSLLNRFYKK